MKRSTLLKTSICGAAAIATHVGLMHAIPSGTHDRSELIEGGRIAVQLVSASVTTSSPAPAPQAATEKARSETEAPPPATTKPAPAAPAPPKPAPTPIQAKPKPTPPDPVPAPPPETAKNTPPPTDTAPAPPATTSHQAEQSGAPSQELAETSTPAGQPASGQTEKPTLTPPTDGPISSQAGNADSTNYAGAVMKHLSRMKRPRASGPGSTLIAFTVAYSGDLETVGVSRSSGSRRFDRDAQKLVERAAPYPRPPIHANRSFQVEIEGR